jgi:hypothetical protein
MEAGIVWIILDGTDDGTLVKATMTFDGELATVWN